jgi:hypothetical protein
MTTTTLSFSLDLLKGNIHCKQCNRSLTPYDQFIKGEDFQDIDVCKDCFIDILKDILDLEEEKEKEKSKK